MKKIIALLLTVCLSVSLLGMNIFAGRYEDCAETLSELGLFKGVGIDEYDGSQLFELDRSAKRIEALVMLIRLMGEEPLALLCEAIHSFLDVPSDNWAYKYVAYAFKNAYTSGISDTAFDPDGEININAFATLLLRALGYSDRIGDFEYSSAVAKAEEVGLLIKGTYADGNAICLRDDCAYMCLRALNSKMKDSDKTLGDKLIEKGVIPAGSDTKIKATLAVADKNITNAFISSNKLIADRYNVYSEYDSEGRAVKTMEHVVFYNPFAKYLRHYFYDSSGLLVQTMSTNSAASSTLNKLKYDKQGRIIQKDTFYIHDDYKITGDLMYDIDIYDYAPKTTIYEYDEQGRLANLYEKDGKGYVEIEYDGTKAIVRPFDYYIGNNEFYFPDIKHLTVYNDYEEVEYTKNFNANGDLISSYDEEGRVTYLAEYNSKGQIEKEISYTYQYDHIIALSGSNSYSIIECIYDSNGLLTKAIHTYGEQDGSRTETEIFTYRYFGNGKLERILWVTDNESTWSQVHTVFDEYGHMKAPF